MVWIIVFFVGISLSAGAWELSIVFTNDLHAAVDRLDAWSEVIRGADLALDAGDAWEDLTRLTGLGEAWATARRMGELGYDAMVLGNHDLCLGPPLLDLIKASPFPIVVTNLVGNLPVKHWLLWERNGIKVLILGLLWTRCPWPIWPDIGLRPPLQAVRAALSAVPDYDVLIILGHMELAEARLIAAQVPECDLFVLGHNHLLLREPIWVGKVPIVQAGHRANAVGYVRLSEKSFSYELIEASKKISLPNFWAPTILGLGAMFLFHWRQ